MGVFRFANRQEMQLGVTRAFGAEAPASKVFRPLDYLANSLYLRWRFETLEPMSH